MLEKDYLQLSGIQHFSFCPRQWALIHLENCWRENVLTFGGRKLHEKVDDPEFHEKRKDLYISRAVPIRSDTLKLYGVADVVEYHQSEEGIKLPDRAGYWRPLVVEYKFGQQKIFPWDRVQLCAQAVCLEEAYGMKIESGNIFYGRTRRREMVQLDEALRERTAITAEAMHRCYLERQTPPAEYRKACDSCSLYEDCQPKLFKRQKATHYIRKILKED
ncbi:CRISPR-associated protein Cas4 [Tindallia californiensis]|uniref:CRISPR-associated exonuclease Cas4 n=1 Tax=Tindallia californiensis TaxID=159292 RepID=A0A1H3RAS6_9FIRM|nr:CRISPR-associated protein Cas4 [Tindallia californiensis]SDZ22623.1 CRISPR-associated exonuclease, Cas4 family [Tindallia californiensis]